MSTLKLLINYIPSPLVCPVPVIALLHRVLHLKTVRGLFVDSIKLILAKPGLCEGLTGVEVDQMQQLKSSCYTRPPTA